MADPIVTWYVDESGACKVFMHEGDTVRIFSSPNVAAAEKTISAVCIDAFGMSQPDARAFAESEVGDYTKTAALPQTLADHMALLEEQLTDSQDHATTMGSQLSAANSKIAALEAQNAELEKSVVTLTAPKLVPDAPSTTNVLPHNPPERETDGAASEQGSSSGAAAADGGMTDSYGHALPGGKFAPSPAAE